ncbi:MAG: hypothetical protein HY791_40390 [Deltaproteobacteria bacterium]|nr:hypothetical protein [Deltaproteobacteria bacterium]
MRAPRRLEVRPVRTYTKPRYPSFADPLPCEIDGPHGFPFRRELLSALAGVGLVSCMPEPKLDPGGAKALRSSTESDAVERRPRKTIVDFSDVRISEIEPSDSSALSVAEPPTPSENPFKLRHSGLPFASSPFGTGAPSYIPDELARRAIEKVFAGAGFELESEYRIEIGDVRFVASGFDERKRVGYIWATWANLDHDAALSWRDPEDFETAGMTEQSTADDYAAYLAQASWMPEAERARLREEFSVVPRAADFDGTPDRPSKVRSAFARLRTWEAFRRAVAVIYRQTQSIDPLKLSLVEARRLESLPVHVAVISQFDRRFLFGQWADDSEAEFRRIQAITDYAERRRAYQELGERRAADAIARLEAEVRSYVSWLGSQGLF